MTWGETCNAAEDDDHNHYGCVRCLRDTIEGMRADAVVRDVRLRELEAEVERLGRLLDEADRRADRISDDVTRLWQTG